MSAELAGTIALQARVTAEPPSILGSIDALTEMIASLKAMLALSVPPPQADLSAMSSAALELQAQLEALLAIADALAVAGVLVISYVGDAQSHGAKVQAKISEIVPDGNALQAVTFIATEPPVFAALGKILLTG